MQKLPMAYTLIKGFDNDICSNADHLINQSIVEGIKKGKHFSNYPGINFFAWVWYSDNLFHAQIDQYHIHVDTISALTFEELKEKICSKFGNA